MNLLGQRIQATGWSLRAAIIVYVVAIVASLLIFEHAQAADGDFIILREVPARTAYRPGPAPGPVRAKTNINHEVATTSGLAVNGSGGVVARELTDGQAASIVSGHSGPGGVNNFLTDGLAATGARDGAMANARSAGRTPYSAVNSMLTGAPGGGGGVAGAVGGAVGATTGELSSILKGTAFTVR